MIRIYSIDRTITGPERLQGNSRTVRERGYAVNDGGTIRGSRSVDAAVRDGAGIAVGAVSVTAPTRRLRGERFTDEVPEVVLDAANLIEVRMETA